MTDFTEEPLYLLDTNIISEIIKQEPYVILLNRLLTPDDERKVTASGFQVFNFNAHVADALVFKFPGHDEARHSGCKSDIVIYRIQLIWNFLVQQHMPYNLIFNAE